MEGKPIESAWPYRYATGETIRVGDRFRWPGNPAIVVEVSSPDDPHRSESGLEFGGVEFVTSGARFCLEYDEVELEHFEFVMCAENDPNKDWQKDWQSPGVGLLDPPDLWKTY